MRKKEITLAESLDRLKVLGGISSVNENKKGTLSTVEYTKKIGNITFGVIKENGSYFIKSTSSDIINESTFEYIGGLVNKTEYKYPSYADALKNLNMMDITITESLHLHDKHNISKELDESDIHGQRTPFFQEELPILKQNAFNLKNDVLALYTDPQTGKPSASIYKHPNGPDTQLTGGLGDVGDAYTLTKLGGFKNTFPTLKDAINAFQSSNRSGLNERLQKDIQPDQPQGGLPPMSEPQQGPAPEQAPAPMPEPIPDEVPPPAPENQQAATDADLSDDSDLDDTDDSNIDHYVGKLTASIRDSDNLSEEKIKGIMNSIISSLPLLDLSPEDRLELAKRVKRGGKDKPQSEPIDAPKEEPAVNSEEPVQEGFMNSHLSPEEKAKRIIVSLSKLKDTALASAAKNDSEQHGKQAAAWGKGYAAGIDLGIEFINDYFDEPSQEPVQEDKSYPWDKCEKDQEKEYGSKKTADKVCGAIKNHSIKENDKESFKNPFQVMNENKDDSKMNEFFDKLEKNNLIFENSKVKYKNILIETKNNTITLDNGKNKYDFNVTKDTVKKFNYLINEVKIKTITEGQNKIKQVIKETINKVK